MQHTQKSRVNSFVHELVVSLVNLSMHGRLSQETSDSTNAAIFELAALFATGHDDPLVLVAGNGCLHYEGEPLLGASMQAKSFVDLCEERGVRCLLFQSRATAEELRDFLELLSTADSQAGFCEGGKDALLHSLGIFHIDVDLMSSPGDGPQAKDPGTAFAHYQALADCLQESHIAAFQGHDLEIEKACGLVEAALNQVSAPGGLLALASHDFIDSFTVGHSVRVALLAMQVATAGGASRHDLIRVGTAGLLHDIGKSRIPQEVLFKRGRLSEEERAIISEHPRLGGEVLLEQPQLDPATIGAAFCHHMAPVRGYPDPAIPFEPSGISKLVRVCDVFEALTAVRPYKRAMTPLEAYSVMFKQKGGFDEDWLNFFVQSLGVYPQGTFLVLDSGEIGLVTGKGPNPTQPLLQILSGPNGEVLEGDDAITCVLGEETDGVVRRVQEEVPGNPLVAPQAPGEEHDHADEGVQSCCGEDLLTPEPPNR